MLLGPCVVDCLLSTRPANAHEDVMGSMVARYMDQGLADAKAGRKFDAQAMSQRAANLAYTWQTTFPP